MENSSKEFFQQIRNIDKQIDAKFERLERLKSISTKVTSHMSADGARASGTSRTFESVVDKIIDLQNELNDDIDRLVDMKREADRILQQMTNQKQRICIEYRYLAGKTFDAIAEEMGYSVRGILKLNGRALQSADKIMNNEKNIQKVH